MELHYPMQWAGLGSLMMQYHLSEVGPHSSNVGIPIGVPTSALYRCMNKHTSYSTDFKIWENKYA